jgi:UDP-GlcNAc:undecaprenyl-phosphate GlcNAc-1-phosphate transferase
MCEYLLIFLVSLALSLISVPIMQRVAKRFNILDHPHHRKLQAEPVPLLGGVGIWLGFSIATIFCPSKLIFLFLLGALITLILGTLDDVRGISAVKKLFLLIIVVISFSLNGIVLRIFVNLLPDILLTILWTVGIISAFNAIDNMDGLSGGVACISSATFSLIAIVTGQTELSVISLALCGASLGFLRYNLTHSIFMGDGGSFFLGFALASIAVMGGWTTSVIRSMLVPIFILWIPIFDIAFVIVRRRILGITHSLYDDITYCGKDHLSHQLTKKGFSKRKAVFFIYLFGIICSLSACAVQFLLNTLQSLGLALCIFGISLSIGKWLK